MYELNKQSCRSYLLDKLQTFIPSLACATGGFMYGMSYALDIDIKTSEAMFSTLLPPALMSSLFAYKKGKFAYESSKSYQESNIIKDNLEDFIDEEVKESLSNPLRHTISMAFTGAAVGGIIGITGTFGAGVVGYLTGKFFFKK